MLKAGVWYLVARSGRTRSLRTFRVSRVQAVRLLDEPVQRPDDFDLATHWAAASVDFLGTWSTTPVLVRMPADLVWLVRYVQDPRSTEAALAGASEPDADGWVTLTLQFENLEMAGYELMRLGGDLEVLEPADLRAHLVARATQMVERYSSVPA